MEGPFTKDMLARAAIEIQPGQYRPEDIRGYAEKIEGQWYAAAFVDQGDKRVIIAISQGKKRNQVIRDAMTKATQRVTVSLH